jgi:hypothetical protein
MFGAKYFGKRYYGIVYFGPNGGPLVSPSRVVIVSQYFGGRYFGGNFYGFGYWGHGGIIILQLSEEISGAALECMEAMPAGDDLECDTLAPDGISLDDLERIGLLMDGPYGSGVYG